MQKGEFSNTSIVIIPVIGLSYYSNQFIIGENGIIYRDKFWRWANIKSVEFHLIDKFHKYSDRIEMGEDCYTFYLINQKGNKSFRPVILTEEERNMIISILKTHSIPMIERQVPKYGYFT